MKVSNADVFRKYYCGRTASNRCRRYNFLFGSHNILFIKRTHRTAHLHFFWIPFEASILAPKLLSATGISLPSR